MDALDPKIVRVNIIVDGRKTSVSLDALLADMLQRAMGGAIPMAEWVSSQANRLNDVQRVTEEQKRTRAGLSRLVQREALKIVVRPELLPERGEREGEGR